MASVSLLRAQLLQRAHLIFAHAALRANDDADVLRLREGLTGGLHAKALRVLPGNQQQIVFVLQRILQLLPGLRRGNLQTAAALALLGRLPGDLLQALLLLLPVLVVELDHAAFHLHRNQPCRTQLGQLLRNQLQLVRLGQTLIDGNAQRRFVVGELLPQQRGAALLRDLAQLRKEATSALADGVEFLSGLHAQHLRTVTRVLGHQTYGLTGLAAALNIERIHLSQAMAHQPPRSSTSSTV